MYICRNEFWLARKDADRYLSTAYSYLVNTLHPDMVILLGDIFSDGFQASSSHWKDYLNVSELTDSDRWRIFDMR